MSPLGTVAMRAIIAESARSPRRLESNVGSHRPSRVSLELKDEGRRNDLCPCGSGKKFKKCHLAAPHSMSLPLSTMTRRPALPRDIIKCARELFEKQRGDEETRIKTFGQIRPIMFAPNFNGGPLVSVRNEIYQAPEKSTFTNFLFNHGLFRLGDEWRETQNELPLAEQHPLFILNCQANDFVNQQPRQPEGHVSVVPNGPLSFCERFYYDLYTVDDNNLLHEELLNRLRNRDQFQGAMHELFVEATCLRAGFTIVREEYRGPKPKNVEFIAVHKETLQHIAVEAKSRHRSGVMGRPGAPHPAPDTRFLGLINNASAKDPKNPLAIFVDTNLPPEQTESFYRPISLDPTLMSEKISRLASLVRSRDGVDPYNLLVFTNHPQHYADGDGTAPKDHWAAIISNNPEFKSSSRAHLKTCSRPLISRGIFRPIFRSFCRTRTYRRSRESYSQP